MSLFFKLLPTDLQIHVYFGWINGKICGDGFVRALSSLDIACTSKADRPAFRHLISTIPPFGERFTSRVMTKMPDLATYLQWLASRKVAVKYLMFTSTSTLPDQNAISTLTLPFITTVSCLGENNVSNKVIGTPEGVLQVCPNVTCIQDNRRAVPTASIADYFALAPKLKILDVETYKKPSLQWVEANGAQLWELRLRYYFKLDVPLAEAIGRSFPLLQTMEIVIIEVGSVLLLLRLCPDLGDLVFHGDLPPSSVVDIAAPKQVKKLYVDVPSVGDSTDLFADVVELRPDLKFRMNGSGCMYGRMEGKLLLHHVTNPTDPTLLSRILTACSPVCEFMFRSELLNVGTDKVIAERLGSGLLTSLYVSVSHDSAPLEVVLQYCGLTLLHLSLANGDFTDEQLMAVLGRCPNLQSLLLIGFRRLTVKSLQAMIDCKLPLKKLSLSGTCFKKEDGLWFAEQARQHQLLPVPFVDIYR